MKPPLLLVSVLAALLGGCQAPANSVFAAARPPEFFPTPLKANPPLPFSEAVRVGDMLYLAGQLGTVKWTPLIGQEERSIKI